MKLNSVKNSTKTSKYWTFSWLKARIATPNGFFALVGFGFGLLFILLTPPFQTPDEAVHFYRAYQISQFNMIPDRNPDTSVGGRLPGSLGETVLLTTTNPTIQFESGAKYGMFKTREALSIDEKATETKEYNLSATALYSPVAYLPQASGIGAARLLKLPPVVMMYSARLFNLLAWIALVSFAITLIPHKKWAVAIAGLIPMAISQAGSLSTDVMATGSIFLFMALIYKLANQKTTISTKQILTLTLTASVALLSKQVMIVFLPLLLLLLPLRKLGTRKLALGKLACAGIMPIITLAVWTLITKGVDATATFTNGQNPAEQVKFVLQNPHSFINVLWNTHFFTWGDSITKSFIGIFGWMDTPLSDSLAATGYIVLFLVLTAKPGYGSHLKSWLSNRQKLLLVGVALMYWAIVNVALYVLYSPVGFKIVFGLQGRYFLPLMLLFIPLLYTNWLRMSEHAYRRLVVYAPVFLLFVSMLTIFYRYYINNV